MKGNTPKILKGLLVAVVVINIVLIIKSSVWNETFRIIDYIGQYYTGTVAVIMVVYLIRCWIKNKNNRG